MCAGGSTNQTDELSLAEVDFKTDILQNIFNSSAKHITEFVISSIGEEKNSLPPDPGSQGGESCRAGGPQSHSSKEGTQHLLHELCLLLITSRNKQLLAH